MCILNKPLYSLDVACPIQVKSAKAKAGPDIKMGLNIELM
jgi:hypothetical protein